VVALNWLLSQPGVVAPVIGVSRLEQLEEAVSATELRLSPQQLAALGAARDD
jgi:aryl-alcohol dehydrogenase-like predicted oxidoreductase